MTAASAHTDGGAAALTSLLVSLVGFALVVPLVLVAADVAVAGTRARTAAEAAALAVMRGSPLLGGDGRPDTAAGDDLARQNGGTVTAVDLTAWPLGVVVETTSPATGPFARLVGPQEGRAASRVVPP